MPFSLDSSKLKIGGAGQHLQELNAAIDSFVTEGNAYAIDVHIDQDRREYVATFRVLQKPPMEWAVVVGEILYDIRSALDHLALQLVLQNGDDSNKGNLHAPGHLRRQPAGMICFGCAGNHQGTQPFYAGEPGSKKNLLWILHELTNIDKHRTLHLA